MTRAATNSKRDRPTVAIHVEHEDYLLEARGRRC